MKKLMKTSGSILLLASIGGVIGYSAGYLIAINDLHFSRLDVIIFSLALIISYILHIIIHEAGHGIFGKLTGYKMISYRIFSFMWVWQKDGSIAYRRFKVPGTLGQCLMAPPLYEKGHFPFRFYLLGGVLTNLIFSAIVGILFLPHSLVAVAFVLTGVFIAITNILPMGFNDGMSLKIASSGEDQRCLLYIEFEANHQLNQGKTYLELPETFFELIPAKPRHTYFNDYQQFLRIARFSEEHNWSALNEQLESLWKRLDGMIPLYQIEIKKELIFSLSLSNTADQRLSQLWSNKQVQMSLKQPLMGNKRIKAAYYYYAENDSKKALDYLQAGKNLTSKSPNLGDATSELKLNNWLQEQILVGNESNFI